MPKKPPFRTLKQAVLKNKKVLMRAGFDVPIENGVVVDHTRIEAVLPTMKHILKEGGLLILMAHQGRPKERPDAEFSQKPLVPVLEKLLGVPVHFAHDCIGPDAKKVIDRAKFGEVVLLENLRFHAGEKKNDPDFAKALASLGDVYINDAFSNAHREHASMVGVPKLLPSFMGLQIEEETKYLVGVLHDPKRPITLIISGAKMETKIPVIKHFLQRGDNVLLGGCIANTFIAARGFGIGRSKYDGQGIEDAQRIMLESEKENCAVIHVPRDVVVASEPSEDAEKIDIPVEDIVGDMAIFDIGKVTIKRFTDIIEKSGTIIWNGPLGMHELNRFSHATKRIAEAIAAATKNGAVSIIGGGDTLDFHDRYNYSLDAYTFVSTGGGAMLELLSGKKFASLDVLRAS